MCSMCVLFLVDVFTLCLYLQFGERKMLEWNIGLTMTVYEYVFRNLIGCIKQQNRRFSVFTGCRDCCFKPRVKTLIETNVKKSDCNLMLGLNQKNMKVLVCEVNEIFEVNVIYWFKFHGKRTRFLSLKFCCSQLFSTKFIFLYLVVDGAWSELQAKSSLMVTLCPWFRSAFSVALTPMLVIWCRQSIEKSGLARLTSALNTWLSLSLLLSELYN